MVQPITTQITIALPPSEVKKIFLTFKTFPRFTTGFRIRHLEPRKEIVKGDQLEVSTKGHVMKPIVLENEEGVFSWQGGGWGVGRRRVWRFEAIEEGTRFVQEESFDGILSSLYDESWPHYLGGKRAEVERDMEKFNADFKKWCDSGKVGDDEP